MTGTFKNLRRAAGAELKRITNGNLEKKLSRVNRTEAPAKNDGFDDCRIDRAATKRDLKRDRLSTAGEFE